MTTKYVSLSAKNEFSFTCPVFNADTKMSACVRLRDLVTAGKIHEKRLGCQAAMKCSMCPAAAMVKLYWQNKNFTNDHHGSLEPKKGRLHAQVLEKVARVSPYEGFYKHLQISTAEEQLMFTAQERIREQLKTAPGETFIKYQDEPAPKRRKSAAPKPAPIPNNDALSKAARTGDMAAAISAAA